MNLLDDLEEIQNTLNDYFKNSYQFNNQNNDTMNVNQPQSNSSQSSGYVHHHHVYNHQPAPVFINNPAPIFVNPAPIIINNSHSSCGKSAKTESRKKSEEKEDKKELSRGEIIVGMTVIAGMSAASVYVFSQDEYIKFYLSQIDDKISALKKYSNSKLYDVSVEIDQIITHYDAWKKLHTERTLNKCYAKVIGTGSLLTGVTAFIVYSNVALAGLFGGILSGCYLLWKYLTDNMRREYKHYDLMDKAIKSVIKRIEFDLNNPKPSAPPAYDEITRI